MCPPVPVVPPVNIHHVSHIGVVVGVGVGVAVGVGEGEAAGL